MPVKTKTLLIKYILRGGIVCRPISKIIIDLNNRNRTDSPGNLHCYHCIFNKILDTPLLCQQQVVASPRLALYMLLFSYAMCFSMLVFKKTVSLIYYQ